MPRFPSTCGAKKESCRTGFGAEWGTWQRSAASASAWRASAAMEKAVASFADPATHQLRHAEIDAQRDGGDGGVLAQPKAAHQQVCGVRGKEGGRFAAHLGYLRRGPRRCAAQRKGRTEGSPRVSLKATCIARSSVAARPTVSWGSCSRGSVQDAAQRTGGRCAGRAALAALTGVPDMQATALFAQPACPPASHLEFPQVIGKRKAVDNVLSLSLKQRVVQILPVQG